MEEMELLKDNIGQPGPGQLDILARRILGKYVANEQILFQVEDGPVFDVAASGGYRPRKVPLRTCICNCEPAPDLTGASVASDAVPPFTDPIRCVKIIPKICKARQEIWCNTKAVITIKYKLILILECCDCEFETLILPRDFSRICYGTSFPVQFRNETLDINEYEEVFVWKKVVPLSEFGNIPRWALEDLSLESHVIVRDVDATAEVMGPCVDEDFVCTPEGCSNTDATRVDLAVFAKICDKLGVLQDVLVDGEPIDC